MCCKSKYSRRTLIYLQLWIWESFWSTRGRLQIVSKTEIVFVPAVIVLLQLPNTIMCLIPSYLRLIRRWKRSQSVSLIQPAKMTSFAMVVGLLRGAQRWQGFASCEIEDQLTDYNECGITKCRWVKIGQKLADIEVYPCIEKKCCRFEQTFARNFLVFFTIRILVNHLIDGL